MSAFQQTIELNGGTFHRLTKSVAHFFWFIYQYDDILQLLHSPKIGFYDPNVVLIVKYAMPSMSCKFSVTIQ